MRHCGKFSSLERFSVLGLGFQIVNFGFQYIVGNMAKGRTCKYNIRRNVNSDFCIVTMRRVAIIFFELGVVKNFMQKI